MGIIQQSINNVLGTAAGFNIAGKFRKSLDTQEKSFNLTSEMNDWIKKGGLNKPVPKSEGGDLNPDETTDEDLYLGNLKTRNIMENYYNAERRDLYFKTHMHTLINRRNTIATQKDNLEAQKKQMKDTEDKNNG